MNDTGTKVVAVPAIAVIEAFAMTCEEGLQVEQPPKILRFGVPSDDPDE